MIMRIEKVNESSFADALKVYSISWKESHRTICSAEFLENRDYAGYLRKKTGELYLATTEETVGVFCLRGDDFSDLYIHPVHQGKGYGTACLRYAMEHSSILRLTVLSNNEPAIGLYLKMGFRFTGRDIARRAGLTEREMIYRKEKVL